mmetsp:Transcript_6119/g.13537  ORF Transcript_6119/g.13537 Transcript_6119/m.13537 type:complete len:331 (-) Transcript_6119:15-1007(-)
MIDLDSEDPSLADICNCLDDRARSGPPVTLRWMLCLVALLSLGLVATNLISLASVRVFRVLWIGVFAVNVLAVSMPGRLDRMYKENNHIKPWQSLLEPASWAFGIWGAIYLGELALSLYASSVGFPAELFQRVLPYWIMGNWMQSLWCFVFRAEFKNHLWVPTLCLLLSAAAFTAAHGEASAYLSDLGPAMAMSPQAWVAGLLKPVLATHASWVGVAAMINLNSWLAISMGKVARGLQATVAFSSAFVIFGLGAMLTLQRGECMFAATAAWSLSALSYRAAGKALQPKGIVAPDVHESIAAVEGILAGVLKCMAVGALVAPLVALGAEAQ